MRLDDEMEVGVWKGGFLNYDWFPNPLLRIVKGKREEGSQPRVRYALKGYAHQDCMRLASEIEKI